MADETLRDELTYEQANAIVTALSPPAPAPRVMTPLELRERWPAVVKALQHQPGCTGVAAVWCPIHGGCTCPDDSDMEATDCPLHAWNSSHAEPPTEAP